MSDLPDLAPLKAAINDAIRQHGSVNATEVKLGLNRDSLRAVLKGKCRNPNPSVYRAFGLPVPECSRFASPATRRLPSVVRSHMAAGRTLTCRAVARDAGCSPDAARQYLNSLGLIGSTARTEAAQRKSDAAERTVEMRRAEHQTERQQIDAERLSTIHRERTVHQRPIDWRAVARNHLRRERRLREWAAGISVLIEREPDIGVRLAAIAEIKSLGGRRPKQGVVITPEKVRAFWGERRGA